MGNNSSNFFNDIKKLTFNHFPSIKNEAIKQKPSKNNNYLGITVTVFAENQKQLDDFYLDVTKHPDVKMVL